MSFDTKSLYMRGHSGQIPQAESIRQAELHSKAMDLAFNQADRWVCHGTALYGTVRHCTAKHETTRHNATPTQPWRT